MPGVSSKAWRHKKKKSHQKSNWDNAGYGLFFAHRLFGQLGRFFVASGNRALLIDRGTASDFACRVEGTVVSMRLDLSDEAKIEEHIRKLKDLAHEVKQRLGVKSVSFESVEGFIGSGSLD